MAGNWIALVGPELEENLSLRYLASSLKTAGFRSEIIPFNYEHHLPIALHRILSAPTPPLMVGISLAFQWRALDFLGLAVALREAGYQGHITVGGHFATFACHELLRDFAELDSICRHESEETIVELARALESGAAWTGLSGLCRRNEQAVPELTPAREVPDLAHLPWPDRRGEPAACFGHPIAPLVSTRGCYANCTFCCIAAWHEVTTPGKRYRERPLGDVADEMVAMSRERGVEVFVFHDDNFFLPGWRKNLERFNALADAIESRGLTKFATVVKARPTDVHPEVFRVLQQRLNCIRCYIGVETDADQGLVTLKRWARPKHNKVAMNVVRDLDLYVCFNMLIFDPDTTIESLETNLVFMHENADYPFNFGRTELYAGTPLLDRMLKEGRCRGDYAQWDYSLGSPEVERVFHMAIRAFHERNFAQDALANSLMGTRFDIEVCRKFHPDVLDPRWPEMGRNLSRALGRDSVVGLRKIIDRVKDASIDRAGDDEFADEIAIGLRAVEVDLRDQAGELAWELQRAIGQGVPLTSIGDRVATSLQRGIADPRGVAEVA